MLTVDMNSTQLVTNGPNVAGEKKQRSMVALLIGIRRSLA